MKNTGSLSGAGVQQKPVTSQEAAGIRDNFTQQLDSLIAQDNTPADLDPAVGSVHIKDDAAGAEMKASTQSHGSGSASTLSISSPDNGMESHVYAESTSLGFLLVQGVSFDGSNGINGSAVLGFNFNDTNHSYMTETIGLENELAR